MPFGSLSGAMDTDWVRACNATRVCHVRFYAGPAAIGGGNDFAVVTFWPAIAHRPQGVILVLSGNLNETHYKLDC